jgi:signal transduction histidine kinase
MDELSDTLKTGQKIQFSYTGRKNITQDAKIIKNIMLNLLSNASKYSEENKNIYLNVEVEENSVTIQVRDEGIGIPEEDQERLFNRFYRAKNAINIQGTGLGLNIVRKYVELLEGTIGFVSRLNEGSTFTVRFPA